MIGSAWGEFLTRREDFNIDFLNLPLLVFLFFPGVQSLSFVHLHFSISPCSSSKHHLELFLVCFSQI